MRRETDLDRDFTDFPPSLTDRRDFLRVLGGGIFVFVSLGDIETLAQQGQGRLPSDFNAFLRIGKDGRVTGFTGKIEMGQGVITSLAQMLAEELNVSIESVEMVMGDTDRCPWDMGTFGSMTTRFFGPALRAAAAEARAVLMELAAERLDRPVEALEAVDGAVRLKDRPEVRATYGELANGQTIARRLDKKAVLESPAAFTVVGRPLVRLDGEQKVLGSAQYTADIRLPDMLYAVLLRPQVHGAALKSADLARAEAIEGVLTVKEGDLWAVLHEKPDVAARALEQVEESALFDEPEKDVDDKTIFDHILKTAPEGRVVATSGDVGEGEAQGVKLVEETYRNSYVAHAPMEPHAALAHVEGKSATVWASTQTPFRLKEEVAQAIGLQADQVRVITPFVGGGFGGKTRNQQGVEAARLSKACGRPVQVAWSRREEFFFDTFRPAAVVKIRSGVDDQGRIALWDYHVYCAGERGAQHFYDIPNSRTVTYGGGWGGSDETHLFATGAWRAPGNNTNTHARESQIDILAALAGEDPLAFRLKNLKDARMIGVLNAAAERFGWTAKPAPSGRGYGIACGIDAGTYVALMAEVAVDEKTGEIEVKRVVAAQDMGLSINPEGARIQMEGCVMMGLGYTLAEEVRFKGGRILDSNFGTYRIPRFSWLPRIETVILDLKDAPPQGGGEPAIIAMGGVIANALFDACGVRLFQLPMTPERVKEGLAAKRG